jgi:hypothetical protein
MTGHHPNAVASSFSAPSISHIRCDLPPLRGLRLPRLFLCWLGGHWNGLRPSGRGERRSLSRMRGSWLCLTSRGQHSEFWMKSMPKLNGLLLGPRRYDMHITGRFG